MTVQKGAYDANDTAGNGAINTVIAGPKNEFQSSRRWDPTLQQHVMLWNPADSGVNATITYFAATTDSTTGDEIAITLYKDTQTRGAEDTTYITAKNPNDVPLCDIYQGEDVNISGLFGSLQLHSSQMTPYWSIVGMIIVPGVGFAFKTGVDNANLAYELSWTETVV